MSVSPSEVSNRDPDLGRFGPERRAQRRSVRPRLARRSKCRCGQAAHCGRQTVALHFSPSLLPKVHIECHWRDGVIASASGHAPKQNCDTPPKGDGSAITGIRACNDGEVFQTIRIGAVTRALQSSPRRSEGSPGPSQWALWVKHPADRSHRYPLVTAAGRSTRRATSPRKSRGIAPRARFARPESAKRKGVLWILSILKQLMPGRACRKPHAQCSCRALKADVARTERDLLEHGDGLSLTELAAEADSQDRDRRLAPAPGNRDRVWRPRQRAAAHRRGPRGRKDPPAPDAGHRCRLERNHQHARPSVCPGSISYNGCSTLYFKG